MRQCAFMCSGGADNVHQCAFMHSGVAYINAPVCVYAWFHLPPVQGPVPSQALRRQVKLCKLPANCQQDSVIDVGDSFWIEFVIEIVIAFVIQTFDQVNITIAST